MRDDFSEPTKRKLAGRAGYVCSVPECRRPTHGAALGSDSAVSIVGVAAHITAASPGGPRYDSSLTPEARRSLHNGIWCCANHAKQIDSDAAQFPVERLRKWKGEAEADSHQALLAGERPPGAIDRVVLDDDAVDQAQLLGLSPADTVAAVSGRLRAMGAYDLRNLRRGLRVPDQAFELSLRLSERPSNKPFPVAGLAAAISTFSELVLVAPPGTGKTTTLLLAAEAMLERGDLLPIFVPLGEWSTQSATLFQSILRRRAFQGAREEYLRLLAIHGRLVILLDGWNELDPAARNRLRAELGELRRDYSDLAVVISTRRRMADVPLLAPLLEIEALSESQQLRIAVQARGEAGRTLLEHAWRTPGVSDLVAIPLYLGTLLKRHKGRSSCGNGWDALRRFRGSAHEGLLRM